MNPKLKDVTPSATPSEEEIAAWNELPRDEQLRRLRAVLSAPDAVTPCGETMDEILAQAKTMVAARRA
jgi:uncharacterized protein YbaP (TraB family)